MLPRHRLTATCPRDASHPSAQLRRERRSWPGVFLRTVGWQRWLPVGALLTPFVADLAFRRAWPDSPTLLVLGGLYAAACVAFGFTFASPGRPYSESPEPIALTQSRRTRKLARSAAILLWLLGLAIGAYDIRAWILLPIWLGGIALWFVGWYEPARLPRARRWQWALVIVLMVLAAALRLAGLETLQNGNHDEYITPDMAIVRTRAEVGLPIFVQRPRDIGSLLMVSSYVRRAVFDVAGTSLTTMRLPSALIGIVNVGLTFAVGRYLIGFRGSLIAATALATMTADLAFSRRGDPTIEGTLVWALVTLLLVRGLARKSVSSMALAGLALGASVYLYPSARLALAYAPIGPLIALLDPRLRGRWLVTGIGVMTIGALVGIGPLLVTYYVQPAAFAHDSGHIVWLMQALAEFARTWQVIALAPAWEHLRDALLSYSVQPGRTIHYVWNRGLFEFTLSSLLYGGLAIAMFRLIDWRTRQIAIWFWSGTIALSALSSLTPAVHRQQPAFPAAVLLIGLAADRAIAWFERRDVRLGRVALGVASLGLAAAMAFQTWLYFGAFAQLDHEFWQSQLARYVFTLPRGHHLALVTGGDEHLEFGLSVSTDDQRRVTHQKVRRLVDGLPVPETGTGVSFVFHRSAETWIDVVQGIYPGGRRSELRSPDPSVPFSPLWYVYEVPPDRLGGLTGVDLTVIDATGRREQRVVEDLTVPADLGQTMAFPIEATWRGWARPARPADTTVTLMVPVGGSVVARLGGTEIALSDAGSREARVSSGAFPFSIRSRLARPGDEPGAAWTGAADGRASAFPGPRASRWPGAPRIAVDWLRDDTGELLRRDYDVVIGDFSLRERAIPRTRVLQRWKAELAIERDERTDFELRSDSPARVVIDGTQVWPRPEERVFSRAGAEDPNFRVRLTAGTHEIVVERREVGGCCLALLWHPRGGSATLVPPEAYAALPWP